MVEKINRKIIDSLKNTPTIINTSAFNIDIMNKEKALEILHEEKDYEDELVAKLNENVLDKLHIIPDLEDEDREMVQKGITTIVNDSKIHSKMFNNMIEMVQKDDKTEQHW